jgi:heme oxygenase
MLMARLKEETRSYHDRLERDPLSRGIMGGGLSRAYYTMVLEVYYGLYAPMEGRLAAAADWGALGFDMARRMKAPLLRADLAHLGVPASALATLPRCEGLPLTPGLPAALGCMYVLEGSTLGGQLIGRHVQGALGLGPQAGAAFFNSYGPEVGPLWKEFKAFVELHGAGHDDAVIAAASAMFASLERWFFDRYSAYASGPAARSTTAAR